MPPPARVALALGAGGARGYAHIGVIEVLEEQGYEIVAVAGTSMGAVVGGLHAAGRLEAYTDWVRPLTQRDVLRLLDPSLRGPGAIRGEKILAKVTELLGGVAIQDLAVPFTAVATDLAAAKEVWFQQGPLDAAIRASMALPSFITPVMMNGRLLADGGLLNPVPVVATTPSAADLTVAVSLSEEHLTSAGAAPIREPSREPDPAPSSEGRERLRGAAQMLDHELVRTVSDWIAAGLGSSSAMDVADPDAAVDEPAAPVEQGPFGSLPPGLRTLDVMQLSLNALQSVVTRFRLAGYPPDVLVTVPRAAARTLDFHRADELIALGRERALEALAQAGLD